MYKRELRLAAEVARVCRDYNVSVEDAILFVEEMYKNKERVH